LLFSLKTCGRLTAAQQEVPLGGILGAGDRRLVRSRRFSVTSKAAEKVGSDGVEQVVAIELEAVQESECGIRSLDLGDRDRAVQATTGLGASERSWLYSCRICHQSVAAASAASLCTALIAA